MRRRSRSGFDEHTGARCWTACSDRARESGCTGVDCYCGVASIVACASSGAADGPCKSTMLEAPGARIPTLTDPSAGAASDAAVAVAGCAGAACQRQCEMQ